MLSSSSDQEDSKQQIFCLSGDLGNSIRVSHDLEVSLKKVVEKKKDPQKGFLRRFEMTFFQIYILWVWPPIFTITTKIIKFLVGDPNPKPYVFIEIDLPTLRKTNIAFTKLFQGSIYHFGFGSGTSCTQRLGSSEWKRSIQEGIFTYPRKVYTCEI